MSATCRVPPRALHALSFKSFGERPFWLRLKRHSQSSPGPGQTKAPGQKMGTDKLEALRNAFTEVASEPPLPATFFVEETRPLTLSGQPDAVAQVETTLVNFRADADGAAAPHDSTG